MELINKKKLLLSLIIITLTLSVYFQVYNYEFVFDDFAHIHDNEKIIKRGLKAENIKWAFTSTYAANWHPLTWLLYFFDYEINELNSGNYHITNLFFHILNSILLFLLFFKLTKSLNRSFLVALFFAIHPLHIESVAWVSGRKDLLSTFFGLFCVYFYIDFAKHKSLPKYFLALLFFALSLMSKAMLVTMPFILLLLDYHPLKRKISLKLIYEKIPYFIIIVPASIIVFIAQKSGGAVSTLKTYPISLRIENAVVSYFLYIKKTLLPFNLAVFYPYPENIPVWEFMLALSFIVIISYIAIKKIKTKPYFFTLWFFYLGTLFPVIGIVKIGAQSMADRYSYVPLIGIFALIVWCIGDIKIYKKEFFLKVCSFFTIIFFLTISFFQIKHWKNSMALFERTMAVSPKAYIMYNNLGISYMEKEQYKKAAKYFRKVLLIEKNSDTTYYNLGLVLSKTKKNIDEAIKNYLKAISINANNEKAINNLGILYIQKKEFRKAVECFEKIVKLKPKNPESYNKLGITYDVWNKKNKANHYFKKALKIDPNYLPSKKRLKKVMKEKYGWE